MHYQHCLHHQHLKLNQQGGIQDRSAEEHHSPNSMLRSIEYNKEEEPVVEEAKPSTRPRKKQKDQLMLSQVIS